MRFISKMKYDHKAFAAAIVHMAVKGALSIQERPAPVPLITDKSYVLRKEKEEAGLSEEEKVILSGLFASGPLATLSKTYDPTVTQTAKKVSRELEKNYAGVYFNTNTQYCWLGIILSLLVIPLSKAVAGAVVIPAYGNFILYPSLIAINTFFCWLLKAPTKKGRELWDKIEGFKMFLTVTEKDRLNLLNPPEKTPELFEKYLPFALALGVEQKWGEQFAQTFATMDPSYAPPWYSGNSWNGFQPGHFASSLSDSVSHTISSAATAPGSSSGGGGGGSSRGGSSGGGGGGGGGGGW
jgi:uncharacterized membrane protein YgcG